MKQSRKNIQLGMDSGTASYQLKKQLMFYMAQQLKMDYCYHCAAQIETVAEISIEHKIPWLDSADPKKLFFDLDNIAFSHLVCNSKASRKVAGYTYTKREEFIPECGTLTAYGDGCRCPDCKKVKSDNYYKNKPKSTFKPLAHPSMSHYVKGCRCDECTAISSDYHKKRRAKLNKE